MSKIAGIKGHSPEAYGDNSNSSGIQTLSAVHTPPFVVGTGSFTSLLQTQGPIEVEASASDRAIIMFSGVFLDPNQSSEGPTPGTITVTVEFAVSNDGGPFTSVYAAEFTVPFPGFNPAPVSYSMFFETESGELTAGLNAIDVRAEVSTTASPDPGLNVTSVNASAVVILTPV
jgi:hypothetical protein